MGGGAAVHATGRSQEKGPPSPLHRKAGGTFPQVVVWSGGEGLTYAIELFQHSNLQNQGFRWLHVLAGITWIGLLYYFNLVQAPAFAKFEAATRNEAIVKLASRALWWFRWAAVATVIFGLLITSQTDYFDHFFKRPDGLAIFLGMVLGIVMFLNVWGVIWRGQKVVIANAAASLAGQSAVPGTAEWSRRAFLASRQNVIFSVPMLWFMVGKPHFYQSFTGSSGELLSGGKIAGWLLITLAIVALLELNALGLLGGREVGRPTLWPYESHRNAIISAFVLWAIFWILSELLLKV